MVDILAQMSTWKILKDNITYIEVITSLKCETNNVHSLQSGEHKHVLELLQTIACSKSELEYDEIYMNNYNAGIALLLLIIIKIWTQFDTNGSTEIEECMIILYWFVYFYQPVLYSFVLFEKWTWPCFIDDIHYKKHASNLALDSPQEQYN